MAKNRIELALERAMQAKQRRDASKPVETTHGATSSDHRAGPTRPMPRFPEIAYDPEKCARNRVMLAETGSLWHGGAASYRVLRTRILQRARSNRWTSIGVTSPGPGDGKSLTTLNLALSIAREGNNNVFLIDLDMRNPKMCDYLGLAPPLNIDSYLKGEGRPEDVLFSIGIERLTLAGTITRTSEASELLASGGLEKLFAYIRDVAPDPIILMDLPPLLSTDDALVVAPKADACLLVLSEGHSRRDSASKALELLAEFTIAGIVLNRSRAVVKDYHYSYY
jgi:Mrp family chromosome partitioning ATPase